jgi:hypothetical protein
MRTDLVANDPLDFWDVVWIDDRHIDRQLVPAFTTVPGPS